MPADAVEIFLIVFPTAVKVPNKAGLVPDPCKIRPAAVVPVPALVLVRLATRLLLTVCPKAFEKEIKAANVLLALDWILLATVGLPMVLLLTVQDKGVTVPCMEITKKAGTVAGAPVTTKDILPIVLPLIVVNSGVPVPAKMAWSLAEEPDKLNTILLVVV